MPHIGSESFDVLVIGAGPAGEKAAAQAAYFGKQVALIERAPYPGGACANTGTLPSKTLRETAVHLSGLYARGLSGVHFDLSRTVTAQHLRERRERVSQAEQERILKNIGKHGVTYVEGGATFEDSHTVRVRCTDGVERRLHAPFLLIATGSSPHRPPEVPFDDQAIWDSDTVLALKEVPESIIIVGAGVIGSEYACIFGALGARVELLDGRDHLLPFLDGEIGAALTQEMGRLGVKLHFQANVKEYRRLPDGIEAVLADGTALRAQTLLFAAGRNGNTRELALERAGLQADKRGLLKVNEHYQTEVPHIYAAGDVIGFPALASTSMDQGRLAMCHALGLTYRRQLAEHLPMGIYTIPEVSAVGETEETARAKGLDFEVGCARFADNPRAQIMGATGGMLKLVFETRTLKLLGVHLVCERASEIIAPGLVALRLGAGIGFFIDTVFNYPTLSEAYKYAAYDGLGRLRKRGIETGSTPVG
jgi:NAD(P) transhydrogenase